MYRGMFFKNTKPDTIKEALWFEEQCVRRQGGYDLDATNLPDTAKWFPKGTVLKFEASTGKCAALKSAMVAEAAKSGATTLKISAGSFFNAGDTVAGVKVSAISRGDSFDTLTVAALTADVKAGDIVDNYADGDKVIGFQYDTFPIDKDASQQVTPTLVAMEIEEASLPFPVSDKVKAALNENGIALFKIQ